MNINIGQTINNASAIVINKAIRSAMYSILPLILLFACKPPNIQISWNFDRGSIGELVEVEPGHFKGNTKHWLKRDSIGDQYYWFYFKLDHVRDKEVTIELNELIGVYRENPHVVYTDYTQPVYSYDQQNWQRIGNVEYDSASYTFKFSHTFGQEPVWIAYAHPYPTSRLQSLLEKIEPSEFTEIKNIATTRQGREVPLIKITDPQIPDASKRNILIIALQHAGEDAGGYMAEGMIDFLISDNEEAKKARAKYNYMVVPMMNPDGIYNGTSRYNMEMEDLNNIWLNDKKAQPEVTGVKNWVASWYAAEKEIDLFIDIHNHSQFHQYHVFIFQDHDQDSLVTIMDNYWPIRIWHSEFEGSSCAYFHRQGIPSGTIELSQSHLEDGKYLGIDDYHSYGMGTVKALTAYFEDDGIYQ
jgi:hypothetical protein